MTNLPSNLRGLGLIYDPRWNKGTGFTEAERDALGLRGLLPGHRHTQEEQAARFLRHLRALPSDLEKYIEGDAPQQINTATNRINEIATSINQVSRNSAESADVAQRSVEIATKGAGVVRQTIVGMDSVDQTLTDIDARDAFTGEPLTAEGIAAAPSTCPWPAGVAPC